MTRPPMSVSMAQLRSYDIGASVGTCRRCGQSTLLSVRESRYVRGWSELLTRDFDPGAVRTATCGACASTYPVRSTDVSAAPAARRVDDRPEPVGRDWAYPGCDDRRATGTLARPRRR